MAAGAFYGTAAVAFGRVYAGSKDGRIYSFNKDSGDVIWSHTIGGQVYAGAAAADTAEQPADRLLRHLRRQQLLRAGRTRWR